MEVSSDHRRPPPPATRQGGNGGGVRGLAAVLACLLLLAAAAGSSPLSTTSSAEGTADATTSRIRNPSFFGVAGASAASVGVAHGDSAGAPHATVRVLVIGDHLVCGVAPRSGAVSGVPEGTPSFRMAMARSLAAAPPPVVQDDGASTAAGVRALFVGPQHMRHGGSGGGGGESPHDARLWTGPYAGGWSLTAEEAVRMRLVDDWVAAARPRVVVMVLGGNDLGRAAMAVTASPPAGGGVVYTDGDETDDDDDLLGKEEDAAIDRAIVRRVSLAVVEAAKRAAAALSQAAMASQRGGGVDTCADCTVVVAGLAPLDASRHPHADLIDATNTAIRDGLTKAAGGEGAAALLVWAPIAQALQPTQDFLRPPAGLLPTAEGEARVADAILTQLRPALAHSARANAKAHVKAAATPTIGGRAIKLPSAASLAAGFGITVATVVGLYVAVVVCGARGAAAVLHGQPLRNPTPPPPVRAVHNNKKPAKNDNAAAAAAGAATAPKRRRVGSVEEAKAISAARKAERHAFKQQLAAAATGASARRSSPAAAGAGGTAGTPHAASLLPPLPSAAAAGAAKTKQQPAPPTPSSRKA